MVRHSHARQKANMILGQLALNTSSDGEPESDGRARVFLRPFEFRPLPFESVM
jgi:hypothetical protein